MGPDADSQLAGAASQPAAAGLVPPGAASLPAEARSLPRGRHGLPHTVIVTNQRRRLIEAIAIACAAKGYPAVRIKDITDHARVSRRTFYDLFSDKEACFLAAYDECIEFTFMAVSNAYASGGRSWPARVGAAVRRLLEVCADHPAAAHLVVVDVHTAGRIALERRDAAFRRFAVLLEPGRAELPSALADYKPLTEAVIGGVSEAIYNRIKIGQVDELPELSPQLHYCTLVPFLGHAKALAAAEIGLS